MYIYIIFTAVSLHSRCDPLSNPFRTTYKDTKYTLGQHHKCLKFQFAMTLP